ncbi:MAG: ATP-binding protein [Patescibacteria group bacterium]
MDILTTLIYSPSLDSIMLVVAAVADIFLAGAVLMSNPRSATNRIFSLLTLFTMLWLVTTYIVRLPDFLLVSLELHRFGIFCAAAMSGLFFLLAHTMPASTIQLKRSTYVVVIGSILLMMGVNLSPYAFTGILIANGTSSPLPGPGLVVFSILSTLYSALTVYWLLRKYKHSTGDVRRQFGLVLSGIVIMLALIIGTILIPIIIFNSIQFLTFTPLYTLVFLGMTAYAITKYQLFNIKVLLTQALTLVLCLILFARIFGEESVNGQVIDGVVLVCMAVFGYFLVQSVKKEVQQRERIQLLASELEKSNEQLSEFMSLATHEIRNPATFIKGYAAGALEGDLGELTPIIKDGMQKLYVRANDIIHLGNQYLDKSKLELNQLKYEFAPLDVRKLIEDLVHEFEPAAIQQGITLSAKTDSAGTYTIEADAGKIKEVVANLIDNSIKYTPKGSVTVTLSQKSSVVRVEIADTGVGISDDVIPKLFKKFSRADAQKANILGTGLGLYIAKVFIDAHHGSVRVESTGKDKGSTFIVELPITQPTGVPVR